MLERMHAAYQAGQADLAKEGAREQAKLDAPIDSHPPMKCGSCGGKLVDKDGTGNYTHAGPMLERHGAWPVEEWDEDE
jgi:hypothetical protein